MPEPTELPSRRVRRTAVVVGATRTAGRAGRRAETAVCAATTDAEYAHLRNATFYAAAVPARGDLGAARRALGLGRRRRS